MLSIAPPSKTAIDRCVSQALEEDVARGDLTTQACIDPQRKGEALIRAREELVVCALAIAGRVFHELDTNTHFKANVEDGTPVETGSVVAEVSGLSAPILSAERVALNFMQRLSGVATLTRRFVDALPPGSKTRISDTRKTTPGLRALERYAVRCGGGFNHREDLSAAVLIKDNHIAASGGVRQAIERARAYATHTTQIECEVDSLSQLEEALRAECDIVMLDNFSDAEVREAVAMIQDRAKIEVSGSVSIERIPELARLGVDVISIGALTHSAPAVDLGLDWVR